MEIPNLGILYIRGGIAAINFDEFLVHDVVVSYIDYNAINIYLKNVTNKSLKEKKEKGESTLSKKNIDHFLNFLTQSKIPQIEEDLDLDIEEGAQNYLKSQLGIDLKDIKSKTYVPILLTSCKNIIAFSCPPTVEMSVISDNKSFLSRKSLVTSFFNQKSTNMLPKIMNRSESQTSNKDSTFKLIPITIIERAKKKIQFWIRNRSLLVEEAFREIATLALGPYASQKKHLQFDEFQRGLNKVIGLNLDKAEVSLISLNQI